MFNIMDADDDGTTCSMVVQSTMILTTSVMMGVIMMMLMGMLVMVIVGMLMVTIMLNVHALLLFPVDFDCKTRAHDTTLGFFQSFDTHSVIPRPLICAITRSGWDDLKSAAVSMSCCAHATIDVQCFHVRLLLIDHTGTPRQTPLSMLTTDTSLAQELSMDNNADTPPKDAP